MITKPRDMKYPQIGFLAVKINLRSFYFAKYQSRASLVYLSTSKFNILYFNWDTTLTSPVSENYEINAITKYYQCLHKTNKERVLFLN